MIRSAAATATATYRRLLHHAAVDARDGSANRAYGEAQGGENSGELRNVERLRRAGRRGCDAVTAVFSVPWTTWSFDAANFANWSPTKEATLL